MKTVIVLLLSIVAVAQESYQDKVTLYNDNSYNCRIISIESKKIQILYGKELKETIIFEAIKEIEMETFGSIYKREQGFIVDVDKLDDFISKRNSDAKSRMLAQKEAEKLNSKTNSEINNSEDEEIEIEEIEEEEAEEIEVVNDNQVKQKRWSFSAVLVPYYSGIVNSMNRSYNYPGEYSYYPYTYSSSEINMIWMLSFLVKEKINIVFDFNYSSNSEEVRNERHYYSSGSTADYGFKSISEMGIYTFNLGVKYYLFTPRIQEVNIYFHAGFGKQIASAKEESENLYPSNSTSTSEDNMGEYNEEINSPWLLNFGFGSEYYFNESLSLTAMVRFVYSSAKGTFKSREITPNYTNNYSTETKKSSIQNRIGLGFNFYF